MSKFEKSEWAEKKHARHFLENADTFILERKRLFAILRSFYRYFLLDNSKDSIRVLDLGCGNGALTMELLKEDDNLEATLVDGSSEMLINAQDNLKNFNGMNFIQKTFQELMAESDLEDGLSADFNLVVSSLAIHHLYANEKKSLFQYIYNHLRFWWIFFKY